MRNTIEKLGGGDDRVRRSATKRRIRGLRNCITGKRAAVRASVDSTGAVWGELGCAEAWRAKNAAMSECG
jgi:hypothetical protein